MRNEVEKVGETKGRDEMQGQTGEDEVGSGQNRLPNHSPFVATPTTYFNGFGQLGETLYLIIYTWTKQIHSVSSFSLVPLAPTVCITLVYRTKF